ncbi:MAG: hypothetical protein RDV48_16565 [Candidatus Eremiobacteraeota bacterium]|nr:hypothetical protein [Candidatus Eremiobacteraeota bacterium]
MNKAFLSIVLCLFFTVAFPMPGAASPSRQKDIDDIIEAVFRSQIKGFSSWKEVKVFFLSLYGKDPRDDIMKRFQGNIPPVKKVSKSSCQKEMPCQQFDKETGEKGIVFYISSIRFISTSRAEVDGGYHKDGLASDWGVFFMVKKRSKWVVEKHRQDIVSISPYLHQPVLYAASR